MQESYPLRLPEVCERNEAKDAANAKKKKIEALEDFVADLPKEESKNFQNAVGQDDLNRFDKPTKKKRKNKKRKPNVSEGGKPNTPNANANANNNNRNKPSNKNRNNGPKKTINIGL